MSIGINRKKEKKVRKTRRIAVINICLAVIFAAAVLAFLVWPHKKTMAQTPAFSTDGYEMNAEIFNYYYRDCYDSFLNAYGDMVLSRGLIKSRVSLAEQQYSEDMTWADFFYETAAGNAKRSLTVYLAAEDARYQLSDEALEEVYDQIETIETNAKTFGYDDGTAFLKSHYGSEASMETYKEYLIMCATADQFSGERYSSTDCTEEEMKIWFAENYPDAGDDYDYNTLSFRMIYIPFTEYDLDNVNMGYSYSKENMAAVLEQIREIKDLYLEGEQTEEQFALLAGEYSRYNPEGNGLYENALKDDGKVEQQVRTWLFKNERKPGDMELIEADSGDYLVYLIGEGIPAWEYLAQQGIRTEAWNKWYTSLSENTEIAENPDVLNYIYLIA